MRERKTYLRSVQGIQCQNDAWERKARVPGRVAAIRPIRRHISATSGSGSHNNHISFRRAKTDHPTESGTKVSKSSVIRLKQCLLFCNEKL